MARVLRTLPGTSQGWGPPRHFISDTLESPNGATVRLLTSARQVPRALPFHADPPMTERLRGLTSAIIKPRFVAELPGGRLWGRGYGYVIDASDTLHGDLSPCFEHFAPDSRDRRHDGLRQPWLPRLSRVPGTVAVLNTLSCENFHHWLLDTTPKFGLLREAGWTWDRIDWFTLPASARRRWHRETLQRLGIPEEKILWTTARTHLQAERLLVPSYAEPGRDPEKYDYTPEGLSFVRKIFAESDNAMPRDHWPGKIVISRERTTARRWLAGEGGHRALAQRGFVKIILEEHSLAEQAALFRRARTIVMPTGGGLANLVHCSAGVRVIELFSPAYVPTFSVGLCAALGLEYRALVGAAGARGVAHSDRGGAEDIDVPLERLLPHLG